MICIDEVFGQLQVIQVWRQPKYSCTKALHATYPPYIEHLQTGNKEGKKYYGLSIKAELLKLEKQYHAAKEELGVTGGGCYYEKEIWDKGPVRDKWEELKKTCPYYFCLRRLMGERTNVATYAITNSATGLNMRHLFGDDLLLNSEDERENGGTNEGNDDVLSEEELTTTGTNLQPKTSDPAIPIDPNLDSTLPSSHITATHPTPRRPEPKKARPNANRKPDTGSHIQLPITWIYLLTTPQTIVLYANEGLKMFSLLWNLSMKQVRNENDFEMKL